MLKKIRSFFNKEVKVIYDNESYATIFSDIKSDLQIRFNKRFQPFNRLKFSNLPSYAKLEESDIEVQKRFSLWLAINYRTINGRNLYKKENANLDDEFKSALLFSLLKSNLCFQESDYIYCFNYHYANNDVSDSVRIWLVQKIMKVLISGLAIKVTQDGISNTLQNYLKEVLDWSVLNLDHFDYGERVYELRGQIKEILNIGKLVPQFFFNSDRFGFFANRLLENQDEKVKKVLYQVLELSLHVYSGKPNQKFKKLTSNLINTIDVSEYINFIYKLFEKVIEIKAERQVEKHPTYNHTFITYRFIEMKNINTLKGLVWMLVDFNDTNTVTLLSKLSEKCFTKLPETGIISRKLGNACVFTLENLNR